MFSLGTLENNPIKIYLFLIILSLLSLFPNINSYELRLEEPRRALIAYEMRTSGEYLQPYILGEPYFRKPPLFNWFIASASLFFGWVPLTIRIISIFSTALVALFIFQISYRYFNNKEIAMVSSLFFITFGDVLYHYGWIGEIDLTYTLFVFLMIWSLKLAVEQEKRINILLSGIFAGLGFLLKGFPIYTYYGISLLIFIFYYNKKLFIFKPFMMLSYLIALLIPAVWLLYTIAPKTYAIILFDESFRRVQSSLAIGNFIKHLVTFPLLNLKQTLPINLFILYAAWKRYLKLNDRFVILLLTIVGVNYFPYLISSGSRGRYILPLFPFLAILFGYWFSQIPKQQQKIIMIFLLIWILGRFAYGLVWFPFEGEKKGWFKPIAKEIIESSNGRTIAYDCSNPVLAFYLDTITGSRIVTPYVTPNWHYLVSDREITGERLSKKYIVHNQKIFIYNR